MPKTIAAIIVQTMTIQISIVLATEENRSSKGFLTFSENPEPAVFRACTI
jgi:hypothetical protein